MGLSTSFADHLMLRGYFAEAARLSPFNRYIRTRVGYDEASKGNYPFAISVLATDPWSADLTYAIAAIYYYRQETNNAQAYIQRFVEIAPRSKFIVRGEPSPSTGG